MKYNLKIVEPGKFGEFSKITEEYKKLKNAYNDKRRITEIIEIIDLIIAIEAYTLNYFDVNVHDLIKMIVDAKETSKNREENK